MITQILITSLVCFGIYKATRYKAWMDVNGVQRQYEILGLIKRYGDLYLPSWIRKPLYDCPPCMGSVWSVVTSLYFGFGVELLLIIPAVSGLNYILVRLFPYSED